jgi:hypothetical protein
MARELNRKIEIAEVTPVLERYMFEALMKVGQL